MGVSFASAFCLSDFVVVRHENGSETFANPQIPLVANDSKESIPMRLAFCLTVNKSKSQTFDRVGIHLERPVFSLGQSSVRSPENLSVYTGQNDVSGHSTTNIVYHQSV